MNQGTSEGPKTSVLHRAFDEKNMILPGPLLFGYYLESYFEKRSNELHKIDPSDLDFSSRELFVRCLESIVSLLVCLQFNFSCASIGGLIQL